MVRNSLTPKNEFSKGTAKKANTDSSNSSLVKYRRLNFVGKEVRKSLSVNMRTGIFGSGPSFVSQNLLTSSAHKCVFASDATLCKTRKGEHKLTMKTMYFTELVGRVH